MIGRWIALGSYAGAIWTTLGVAPRVANAVLATPVGAWMVGRGAWVLAATAIVVLALGFAYRRASWGAWGLLGLAGAGYVLGLVWLRSQRIERLHLPEYGVAAWLAWRAVAPIAGDGAAGYVAAVLVATGIGWSDELLQTLVPGRVYDLRDVVANALGAALGVVVLAAVRMGGRRTPQSQTVWR